MLRHHTFVFLLLGWVVVLGGLNSCKPQNAPTSTSETIERHPVPPIPILEGMPDSLAELDWIRTAHRFGETEKKRVALHSYISSSFASSSSSSLSSSLSLSFNPVSRGPLSCWSAMCDPMPTSAAPEALSALIPRGTTLIVEMTYPHGSMSVSPDAPYLSSELGFPFTPNGHDAFLSALRDTLTALVSRGSLPQVACIIAYPYADNLLEE